MNTELLDAFFDLPPTIDFNIVCASYDAMDVLHGPAPIPMSLQLSIALPPYAVLRHATIMYRPVLELFGAITATARPAVLHLIFLVQCIHWLRSRIDAVTLAEDSSCTVLVSAERRHRMTVAANTAEMTVKTNSDITTLIKAMLSLLCVTCRVMV